MKTKPLSLWQYTWRPIAAMVALAVVSVVGFTGLAMHTRNVPDAAVCAAVRAVTGEPGCRIVRRYGFLDSPCPAAPAAFQVEVSPIRHVTVCCRRMNGVRCVIGGP